MLLAVTTSIAIDPSKLSKPLLQLVGHGVLLNREAILDGQGS